MLGGITCACIACKIPVQLTRVYEKFEMNYNRLQNAVKYAIDKQSIQKIMAKCRHLVGHFKHSALASDGLIKKQKALGFKNHFVWCRK